MSDHVIPSVARAQEYSIYSEVISRCHLASRDLTALVDGCKIQPV